MQLAPACECSKARQDNWLALLLALLLAALWAQYATSMDMTARAPKMASGDPYCDFYCPNQPSFCDGGGYRDCDCPAGGGGDLCWRSCDHRCHAHRSSLAHPQHAFSLACRPGRTCTRSAPETAMPNARFNPPARIKNEREREAETANKEARQQVGQGGRGPGSRS